MATLFCVFIKKGVNYIIAFLSTIIISYFLRESFSDRAQIISYFLFLIEIILIENFLRDKKFLQALRIVCYFCFNCKYSFNYLDNVFSIIFTIYW